MQRHRQLTFEGPVALADLVPDPGADHGEVFTRRWVVELILDLVGYTPDQDLGGRRLLEPSCGTGAFLLPAVERLLASAREHGRDPASLGGAICAVDLLGANADLARKAVAELLEAEGVSAAETQDLVDGWIATDDFLRCPLPPTSFHHVVGNPPYIRLENVPEEVMDAYRRAWPTMRGRADVYVGFIERGLDLLVPEGTLAFICADRWMRNQYGADLRELVSARHAVDTVITMHGVDAFEDDVSAYPAVVVLRNGAQHQAAVVDAGEGFDAAQAARVSRWVRRGRQRTVVGPSFEGSRLDSWFRGRASWPAGSAEELALLADLEERFAPLQNAATGTRVGIGVATGCDDVFITSDPHLVEEERLLPLAQSHDIASGALGPVRQYLVDPWDVHGLVDLDRYPRLEQHLRSHSGRLRSRYVARARPDMWYRTIDRVDHGLTARPKLLLPDMKASSHPVLDPGGTYPHHNLYYVVSDSWDLEVLGGLLLSAVAELFVGAYCVKMRGGTYRFQAQYLRRIRVPRPEAIEGADARAMVAAFRRRDRSAASDVAARIYGVPSWARRRGGG